MHLADAFIQGTKAIFVKCNARFFRQLNENPAFVLYIYKNNLLPCERYFLFSCINVSPNPYDFLSSVEHERLHFQEII